MSKSFSQSFHKLTAFFLLAIFSSNFNVFAQTRKANNQTAARQSKPAAKCSGAWTGAVSYVRRQSNSDDKTVKRVSTRGEDKRSWRMKYEYQADVAVVESPEKNGGNIGKATISHSMSAVEKNSAVEENSCDRGKTWQQMRGEFTSTTGVKGSEKAEANVNVGVNSDGTYSVSVSLPQIKGEVTGSETSVFSGQCTKKEGKNLTMPPTSTTIDGNSITSDGTHRVNPSDPNRLSGSYTLNLPGDTTETISWNLEKCGAPLRLTDLKFEDMKFPNWDDWQEIVEQKGTIDGNWVKVTAKILNLSGDMKYAEIAFKETYKGDKWDGARPDYPLKDNSVSVRVEPEELREVEILWDTAGFAWFDDGRPRLVQRVKAEIWEENKLIDDLPKNIKIAPKPVVLVHGLWSSWRAWETWQNILTTSHSYDWKAFPVGEKPEKGVMDTGKSFMSSEQTKSIGENSDALDSYIKYAQEDRNAWHVDVVAHSLGGLISRYYISQRMPANYPDGRPQIAHLVMLGTPNQGSPCAEVMDIAFGMIGKQVEAVRQLQPDYVAGFNRINNNRKGVKFSVLAGNPLPTMCKSIVPNDGVVSVPSAKWTITDNAESSSLHTALTGTKDFSDFVKPRLAIGPRGSHEPEVPSMPNRTGQNYKNDFSANFVNAAYRYEPQATANELAADAFKPDFTRAVKLAPKQTIEIEVPVEEANNFGLTFMADSQISATLFDDKGLIAGKNLTKTPEAGGWFRSIFIDKPVTKAIWKLKLENTSALEFEAVIAGWKNAVRK